MLITNICLSLKLEKNLLVPTASKIYFISRTVVVGFFFLTIADLPLKHLENTDCLGRKCLHCKFN